MSDHLPVVSPVDSDRIPDLLALWYDSSRSGSSHTRRAKRTDLRAFARYLGVETEIEAARALLLDPAGSVGAAHHVGLWVAQMNVEAYAPSTIARRVASLRSLCGLAHQHGLPWRLSVKGPNVAGTSGVTGPEPEKVWEVLRGLARSPSMTAARNRAIVAVLYLSGLRRSELVSLDLGDFDPSVPSLRVRTKGGKMKRPKIAAYERDAIAAWIRYRGRKPGPLFHAIDCVGSVSPARMASNSIYKLTRALGIGAPHRLRHTAATVLARAGRLDLAQAHLGHSSIGTTGVYLDRAPDDAGEASRRLAGEGPAPPSGDPAPSAERDQKPSA